MKRKRHFLFVTPMSASDGEGEGVNNTGDSGAAALETLLNQMGGSGTTSQNQNTGDGEGDSSAQQNQQGGDQTNGGSGQQNQQQVQQRTQQDKQNYAFGQMRTQINELTELLGRVAKANGVEYSDSKDLIAKLTDDTISRMAQKQNVPVELLREVEALRRDSQAFKQQQLRDAAAIGFQNIMDTYGLTQEQLQQFAVELDQRGKNPFSQPVDLMMEYKLLHYDDILKAEVQKAVQEALKKSGAADQNSSTPNNQQGGTGGGGEKITTVAGLSALLDGMK